jgi:hypothetical protein
MIEHINVFFRIILIFINHEFLDHITFKIRYFFCFMIELEIFKPLQDLYFVVFIINNVDTKF